MCHSLLVGTPLQNRTWGGGGGGGFVAINYFAHGLAPLSALGFVTDFSCVHVAAECPRKVRRKKKSKPG